MLYVIGSGPAGVSVTKALLARGQHVTLLDVGIELESHLQELREELRILKTPSLPDHIRKTLDSKNPVKLSLGSDYPYAQVENYFKIFSDHHVCCSPSFAKGGLSNVWGAFVNEFPESAFEEFPFAKKKIQPYYKEIWGLLKPATPSDYSPTNFNTYQSSQQAQMLWQDWQSNQDDLSAEGFTIEKPQLAAQFRNKTATDCIYCGLCQYGCPSDLIYSARDTLKELQKNHLFSYQSGIIVEDIQEAHSRVLIQTSILKSPEKKIFEGSHVFLAAGALISTALVLKALKIFDKQIKFIDSSHFLIPCFTKKRVKNVNQEKLHALCQLILKLDSTAVSPHPTHLQLYTYMGQYSDKIRQMTRLGKYADVLLAPLIDRMIAIQGFFDSKDSHAFFMKIEKNSPMTLHLAGIKNPAADQAFKKLLAHLKTHKSLLGFTPIPRMANLSKISRSFHYGGSMPMKLKPQVMETDIFGTPEGLKRLHVVDSAILPYIPAGSITPTIMANAYRIGMEYLINDIN